MDHQPFPILHPFAAYLRDSGGDRQELSIEQQRQAIERWAVQNGCTITAWFIDAARPGSSTVGRDQFQALMRHFRDRARPQEEGVVMWKMSRFARDIDDSQFYKADLRRRGYKVISLADNIPDSREGRFFEAAIDWMNDRFLDDLSADVTRGLRNLVENHGAIPGRPPRGLKREPFQIGVHRNGQPHIVHRWVIDPEVASLVLQAFQMRAAGRSLAEINIATHLFSSINSYTTFFTNKIYIGILEYGGLTMPDYCPAIVPLETWYAVQAIVKAHANNDNLRQSGTWRNPKRQNSSYLLSGLLFCSACGSPVNGVTTAGNNGRLPYERYICSAAMRRRDCKAPGLPAKILEDAVINFTIEYMLSPEMMEQSMLAINSELASGSQAHAQMRLDLTRRLTGIRKRLDNITDAIAENGRNRSLFQKLNELELEENQILAQLSDLDRLMRQKPILLDPDQIRQRSAELRQRIQTQDFHETQHFLRGLIQKIIVVRDGNKLTGQVFYRSPVELLDNKSPPDDIINMHERCMSTPLDPVGAPTGRHTFEASFTATMRVDNKKQP